MMLDGLFLGYMLKAMVPQKAHTATKQSSPDEDGMPPVHEEQVVAEAVPPK